MSEANDIIHCLEHGYYKDACPKCLATLREENNRLRIADEVFRAQCAEEVSQLRADLETATRDAGLLQATLAKSAQLLRELRRRVEAGEKFTKFDWGGCGCGVQYEDLAQRTA